MTKIPVDGLIGWFQRMYRERWRYTWGHAEKGDVDCSGAFVYAYRQYGRSIYHGSNTIARKHTVKLLPVSEGRPGMAAFKIRKPGDKYYDLPAKYRKGGAEYNGDLNDYYHIGLIDEDGKHVLNAQGEKAGFTRTKLSAWGAVGFLKAVDYPNEKEMDDMQDMIVTAESGSTVKVRKQPSTMADVLAKLKVGTAVRAGDEANGWRPIVYNGNREGYMMASFLTPAPATAAPMVITPTDLADAPTGPAESPSAPVADDAGDEFPAFVRTLTAAEYNRLCEARDHMAADLEFIRSIVGKG